MRGHEMKKYLAGLAVLMLLVASSPAAADTITLVPSATTVAQGSYVDVAVNLDVDADGLTMWAFSAILNYDAAVFDLVGFGNGSFLDPLWDVEVGSVPGALFFGAYTVVGCDPFNPPYCPNYSQTFAPLSSGTLFTFRLQARTAAELGPSAVSWGDASGSGSGPNGFDYTPGPPGFQDVVVPSDGATITVNGQVPDAGSSLLLLGMGVAGLMAGLRKWRQ
jgi:hypothetical protein